MLDEQREWPSLLYAAEQSYLLLIQHEATLRQQAYAQILALHRDYWGREWRNISPTELLSYLRLNHLNFFFSDSSIELWYAAGAPFQHHELLLTLDSEMRVTQVGLEG